MTGELVAKFSKAWIIRWEFHGQNRDEALKKYGIKNRVVEIFSTRKKFDEVQEYVQALYRFHRLSFDEKAHLENYRRGRKNRREMFGESIPVFTPTKTALYGDMMRRFREGGLGDPEYQRLWEKWLKSPTYISVGHNPSLEGWKVNNLQVFSDDGIEILEWDEPLADGTTRHETYRVERELRQ